MVVQLRIVCDIMMVTFTGRGSLDHSRTHWLHETSIDGPCSQVFSCVASHCEETLSLWKVDASKGHARMRHDAGAGEDLSLCLFLLPTIGFCLRPTWFHRKPHVSVVSPVAGS